MPRSVRIKGAPIEDEVSARAPATPFGELAGVGTNALRPEAIPEKTREPLLAEIDFEAVFGVVLDGHFRGAPVLHAGRADAHRMLSGGQVDQERRHSPQRAVDVDL